MFQYFGVLEKIVYRRAMSRFLSNIFFLTLPKNLVVEPLRFRERFWFQKFPRIGRGGFITISVETVLSHIIE